MERYANNRVELSHQATGQRERYMRRFKSVAQAQRLQSLHGVMQNLFPMGRHLVRAKQIIDGLLALLLGMAERHRCAKLARDSPTLPRFIR